jgi:hypothetical protein
MGVVESPNPVPYTLYLSVFEPHEGSRGVVSFIIGHYYLLSKNLELSELFLTFAINWFYRCSNYYDMKIDRQQK